MATPQFKPAQKTLSFIGGNANTQSWLVLDAAGVAVDISSGYVAHLHFFPQNFNTNQGTGQDMTTYATFDYSVEGVLSATFANNGINNSVQGQGSYTLEISNDSFSTKQQIAYGTFGIKQP